MLVNALRAYRARSDFGMILQSQTDPQKDVDVRSYDLVL